MRLRERGKNVSEPKRPEAREEADRSRQKQTEAGGKQASKERAEVEQERAAGSMWKSKAAGSESAKYYVKAPSPQALYTLTPSMPCEAETFLVPGKSGFRGRGLSRFRRTPRIILQVPVSARPGPSLPGRL